MCEKTDKRISNTYQVQRYKSLRKHRFLPANKILYTQKMCIIRNQAYGNGLFSGCFYVIWTHDWPQFPVPILWKI